MKRLFSLFAATLLALSFAPFSAFAADTSVASKIAELESKYGVLIDSSGASIAINNLETLDMALENLTPAAVRQVSKYYQNKNGSPISISYVAQTTLEKSQLSLALFNKATSEMTIYLSNTFMQGDNPIAIVHEFGHAILEMHMDSYGAEKMQREWTAFNAGYSYSANNIYENPNSSVFISPYAATQFQEDVAEVIGHAFIRYRAGQGFSDLLSRNGAQTGLGKKLAYVEQMLASCLDNATTVTANYRRTYSAPTKYPYQSMKFSGDYMQYAGYPQPKAVLNQTLNDMEIRQQKAAWIRDLGAWYVLTTDNKSLIIFPGGSWQETGKNFTPPI